MTFDATEFPLVHRVLLSQCGLVVSDTQQEQDWRPLRSDSHWRSWICVPLVVSHQTLGLLSVGHAVPETFTEEHLRLSKLLAIPAAAAIQNARLYECAKIYGAELDKHTSDLKKLQSALQRLQSDPPC